MQQRHVTIEAWPRLMTSARAAAYVGEVSTGAFLRGVGALWPQPLAIAGKGRRWLREDLDRAIDKLAGKSSDFDAADVI